MLISSLLPSRKLNLNSLLCPGVRSDEGRLFLLAMNLLSFALKKEKEKKKKLNLNSQAVFL
jgi:hypothetical protein